MESTPTRAIVSEMAAYSEFKDIVHRWLRVIGACLGFDVLQPNFQPNSLTLLTFTSVVTAMMMLTSVALLATDELALVAVACIRLGFKVKNIYEHNS